MLGSRPYEERTMTALRPWVDKVVAAINEWQDSYGAFEPHPSMEVEGTALEGAVEELLSRLTTDNYPFFHPHYAAQMLKPPHPAAIIGYLAAMLINPNNHSLDGGPATAAMEKEIVIDLSRMFGVQHRLGHLTTSGTIANMEALWVSRELRPTKAIAYSADAHYTHSRMSRVLGVESVAVPTDAQGRMDLNALEALLRTGRIGTVVATLGTTGLGALDPLDRIVELKDTYDLRVHVDAAYGGFFKLVADDTGDGVPSAPYDAIRRADSIVVDPHKHGLQPYGCGAVLFADPDVGRFYAHDSPYTYFTSDELHLGEISLECSRAGASAAALWLTTRLLPLTPEGLGAVLRPGRAAALSWHDLLEASDILAPYQRPDLDILTYLPRADSMSALDAASGRIFERAARGPREQQVHLATYAVDAHALSLRGFAMTEDTDRARILRSVLMKPESLAAVPDLHARVEELARMQ
jgi:glutamate/tyrosine decarboxylase-like PLP-dependent enzyme